MSVSFNCLATDLCNSPWQQEAMHVAQFPVFFFIISELVNFITKVSGLHTNSLDRQVTERVNIENFKGGILMNRRNEMGGVRLERMQYRRWGGNQ